MAKAYDKARTREFVPACDRALPVEQQTVFILGWLSVFDFTAIEEEVLNDKPGSGFPKLMEIVRRALRGWRNFPLADGTEAPFERGPDGLPTKETILRIAPRELMEIAKECDAAERLTPEEVGKS